ncbi:hypothetical protein Ancab_021738, partial [Ancistrocladus abbreviatus]
MNDYPISHPTSTSLLAPYPKVPVVKHTPRHPEFLTYHLLPMLLDSIPPKSHYPTGTPMLSEDLGMGMALTSTPYAPISFVIVMMTGIALPEGI